MGESGEESQSAQTRNRQSESELQLREELSSRDSRAQAPAEDIRYTRD